METPLFSLVLLVRKNRHLLTSTLDTLQSQTKKDFEILLLDGEGSGKLSAIVKGYPSLTIRLHDSKSKNLSGMMNQGVDLAKGLYIQFLEAGDRYLSQHGISYLKNLIDEAHLPALVYTGLLEKNRMIDANFQYHSSWFLKKTIREMGGFDSRLSHRPAFDLICRYLLKEEENGKVYSRHVLIDPEPQKIHTLGFFKETWLILFRNFGLLSAFRWILTQDYLQAFRRKTLSFLKNAFWKH